MRVNHLVVHQFRCFEQMAITFDAPIVLIEGDNGTGKTSILEALYYACYVRSFRTHTPRDLVKMGCQGCSVNVMFTDSDQIAHELQVGLQPPKRRVRLDGKVVRSYDEMLSCMRIVAVTDGDAQLIRGGPEGRRAFIDEYILVHEPAFLSTLKTYATVLKHRNALLKGRNDDAANLEVWTRKVWESGVIIQAKRLEYVEQLNNITKELCDVLKGQNFLINLRYHMKRSLQNSYEAFHPTVIALRNAEHIMGYSLFGPHLDDVVIDVNLTQARSFASRGQQKAAILLLKLAQAHELVQRYRGGIMVLDDVMLDFDDCMLKLLVGMLVQLPVQLLFTSAQGNTGALQRVLAQFKPQIVHFATQEKDASKIDQIAKSSLLPPTLNF